MNVEKLQKNLSQIRYLHEKTSPGKVDLNLLFRSVIEGQPLDVNRRKMESVLNNDLSITTSHLDRRLVSVLSEAVATYVGTWPGWLRFSETPTQTSKDYERFRQYLIYKSNYIVKHSKDYHKKSLKNVATQTEVVDKKDLAPYNLVIGGPPCVINNLVFTKHGNDIIIKQHPEKQWQDLQISQFLNWPHLSVTIKLPDIHLTRTNNHKVNRYIALQGDKVVFPEIHYIDHITNLSPGTEFEPYSYTYFFYYFLQLNIVLQKIPNVKEDRAKELALILAEFLNDIREMNVYNSTMATHSCIGYNIGRSHYIRSKKMVYKSNETVDNSSINFFEIIIPQVDVSLHYFSAVQDQSKVESDEITFKSLNLLLNKLDDLSNSDLDTFAIMINNSSVSYSCVLCDKTFSGPYAYTSATSHFSELHKAEQMVLCYKCGKQFDIEFLTNKRWSHNCVPK